MQNTTESQKRFWLYASLCVLRFALYTVPVRRLLILSASLTLLGAGCVRQTPTAQPPPPGGIYRSDDGGVTFAQKVSLTSSRRELAQQRAPAHLARLSPRAVVAVAADPGTLYVAAAEGVFRTTTAGDAWERLPLNAREVFSISVHPGNPQILLAVGTSAFQEGRGKILKSLTAGESWAEVFTAPAGKGEFGTLVRRRQDVQTLVTVIAHDPRAPNVVLAGTNTGTLLASADGGVRWATRRSFRQGITGIEISPFVQGRVMIRLADGQLVRSEDLGTTVERVHLGNGAAEIIQESAAAHAVLFEVPRAGGNERILIGTEAGLYGSSDGGSSWTKLPLPPTGTVDTPVTSLALGADGTLWATSGFVLFSSVDGGATWRAADTQLKQPIRFVVTDPANPKRLYLFFAS